MNTINTSNKNYDYQYCDSKKIRAAMPSTYCFKDYLRGIIHTVVYFTVLIVSWWMLVVAPFSMINLLWSMPFGWAWFCLLMVGHDALHNTLVPSRRLNHVLGYITMDCLLFSAHVWRYSHHVIHHAHPNSDEDDMQLRGVNIVAEAWNLFLTIANYFRIDMIDLFKKPTLRNTSSMVIRIALLISLCPLAIIPCIVSLIVFGNFIGLLPHAIPVQLKDSDQKNGSGDQLQKQLRNSWDLFPASWFASLFTSGLNAHAVHHIFPAIPRGIHPYASQVLQNHAPYEYRFCERYKDLVTLIKWRHKSCEDYLSLEQIHDQFEPQPMRQNEVESTQ